MDRSQLLAYVGAAAALLLLPGPDWAFMMQTSARGRQLAPAVLGLALGYVLMALLVAAGLGPLIAASPAALGVITCLGAFYLLYLGTSILRSGKQHRHDRPDPTSAEQASPVAVSSDRAGVRTAPAPPRSTLWRAVGVSALNPKSLVLFVSFLPQFITPAATRVRSVLTWVLSACVDTTGGGRSIGWIRCPRVSTQLMVVGASADPRRRPADAADVEDREVRDDPP